VCLATRSTRGVQRVYSFVRACVRADSVVGSSGHDNDMNSLGLVTVVEINSLEIGRCTKEPGRRQSHISFTTRCTIGIKSFRSSSFGSYTPNLNTPTRSDRAYFSSTPPVKLVSVRRSVVSLGRPTPSPICS